MTDHHIGMIVPSSNLTMETELPRMLAAREQAIPDDRFVFHAARARMQHVTPEQLKAMNDQAVRAASELADARPDVVATACLVAIMAHGPGFHCTAEDDITLALQMPSLPSSRRWCARSDDRMRNVVAVAAESTGIPRAGPSPTRGT